MKDFSGKAHVLTPMADVITIELKDIDRHVSQPPYPHGCNNNRIERYVGLASGILAGVAM